ncbi:DUF1304 domain-containing protein [Lactobacillus porci]|uniref:DUF1304 domain-containing protein n=1 Tax=Lactobacillus porci TaxID=2012477 RepID=UPI003996C8BD
MTLISKVLATLTALEFIYIFYLETIATSSSKTAKTFKMPQTSLREPLLKTAMQNQGVYNLGIALLIFGAVFILQSKAALLGLMLYIIFVAAYGSFTVDKSIILKQGGLAILTLISAFF